MEKDGSSFLQQAAGAGLRKRTRRRTPRLSSILHWEQWGGQAGCGAELQLQAWDIPALPFAALLSSTGTVGLLRSLTASLWHDLPEGETHGGASSDSATTKHEHLWLQGVQGKGCWSAFQQEGFLWWDLCEGEQEQLLREGLSQWKGSAPWSDFRVALCEIRSWAQ